jgi:diaminobutyrate-2-oxoglutarate transaminase
MMFPGPNGASAVEAAIRIARNVTGRSSIVSFTNAFHGCTLGALSLTGSQHHRGNFAGLHGHVSRMPFDGYFGPEVDTASQIRKLIEDPSSGVDQPAAFILETTQAEGGLNVASSKWLNSIAKLAKETGALLIIDDIQAGCGRSGDFFSFEKSGLKPDIVTLAKSLSGYGLPLSLLLVAPAYDQLKPGEHNGTFRGNSHAFVTANAAIKKYWSNDKFTKDISHNANYLQAALEKISHKYAMTLCGSGMLRGIRSANSTIPKAVQSQCFKAGLMLELCGPNDEVIKFLPPLNAGEKVLKAGVSIVEQVLEDVVELVH